VIAAAGIAVERIDVEHELDMHYVGQIHTIAVPLGTTAQGAAPQLTEDSVRAAFETAYDASFGRLLRGLPIAIASLRVSAIGHRPAFDASLFAPDPTASLDRAALGLRPVWFDGDWRDTRIWSRLDLPAGAGIEGPAILEQPDATTVIERGLTGRTDPLGNLIVRAAA
jgi:N-methylhydantoinase A